MAFCSVISTFRLKTWSLDSLFLLLGNTLPITCLLLCYSWTGDHDASWNFYHDLLMNARNLFAFFGWLLREMHVQVSPFTRWAEIRMSTFKNLMLFFKPRHLDKFTFLRKTIIRDSYGLLDELHRIIRINILFPSLLYGNIWVH